MGRGGKGMKEKVPKTEKKCDMGNRKHRENREIEQGEEQRRGLGIYKQINTSIILGLL